MYAKYLKRILDFTLSLIALIVLSPSILAVYVLVRTILGKPAIFRHKRPGKNAAVFTLYKFRTMTDARCEDGNLLPDCERLTRLGKILRATSLDELPELLNILKGDMAIVGPRPLEVYFLPYYSEEESHRHDVRPGLTGLAQINGRNSLTWEQRFAYDLCYIENITFRRDVRIILKTIAKVLKKEGTAIPAEDFNVCRERQKKAAARPSEENEYGSFQKI